jgi:hypothetical protein
MEGQMKVVFDLSAGRLAIEGDGPELIKILEVARDLAPNISQIQIVTSASDREQAIQPQAQQPNNQQNGPETKNPTTPGTMRQFARSLSLSNAPERIAAIAFYVNKIEGRQSFAPKEMDGWFTMCGFQKPSQMPVALFDAKRKYGYIENIGRAMWRISTQGENLIARKKEVAGD